MTQREIKRIAFRTIGCAIEVHKHLGPGLLESVYQKCMLEELHRAGIKAYGQVPVPIAYKGMEVGESLKLDILVEDVLILELKAVEQMHPIFKAQALTYLKLTGKPKALLINFFTDNVSNSIISLVGESFAQLPKE
jgi:GxxExxY protein